MFTVRSALAAFLSLCHHPQTLVLSAIARSTDRNTAMLYPLIMTGIALAHQLCLCYAQIAHYLHNTHCAFFCTYSP